MNEGSNMNFFGLEDAIIPQELDVIQEEDYVPQREDDIEIISINKSEEVTTSEKQSDQDDSTGDGSTETDELTESLAENSDTVEAPVSLPLFQKNKSSTKGRHRNRSDVVKKEIN